MMPPLRRSLVLLIMGIIAAAGGLASARAAETLDAAALAERVGEWERERIVRLAGDALAMEPITITHHRAPLSEGGPNDYYSNGDYWWPDPTKPDGLPYIRRDGESNPDNFNHHRLAMRSMANAVAALAAAWRLTGEERYAAKAVELLRVFFLDEATRMNPHLLYTQAIPGRVSGRGIGVIDSLHLIEVPVAILALEDSAAMTPETLEGLRGWFADYLEWMTTHPYGLAEMKEPNNHSIAYFLQVAAFATLTGDEEWLEASRKRLREVLLPGQMAADGRFPAELGRTKPYGYSLFQAENLWALGWLLSTPEEPVWEWRLEEGQSLPRALDFILPYIEDKATWPYARDIEYWDDWPVRLSMLLLAGAALGREDTVALWRRLPGDSPVLEVRRNVAITQPYLWLTTVGPGTAEGTRGVAGRR